MNKKYSIISLGRLGQRFYEKLDSDNIVGSFNSKPKGLSGEVQYDFANDSIPELLQDSDILLFNLTPSVIETEEKFKSFLSHVRAKKIIFVSSTSVYGNQGEVDEDVEPNPISDNGRLLKSCENLVSDSSISSTIIRPSGIVSSSSHPGKFMSGKSVSVNGEAPLNLIHIDDLVAIIMKACSQDYPVINASNQNHPTKKEYYFDYCSRYDLDLPKFEEEGDNTGKIIKTKYAEFQISKPLP